jgi:RNA polymerase sigma-70 factor (ECF subfamily)
VEHMLEVLWERHRPYLRRMLLGLTRDRDQAEDLLQETYCRAHAGLSGYRGGDARAWLAAIARNVFRAQLRRERGAAGRWADVGAPERAPAAAGSGEHVTRLAVREALVRLSPLVRQALVLRHYLGLSYDEIALRLNCPVGTARRRVWTAVGQLRAAVAAEQEVGAMACREMTGPTMLEYVYDALGAEETARVVAHLGSCAACREEVGQLRELVASLERVEEGMPLMHFAELDAQGVPLHLTWGRIVNTSTEPMTRFGMVNPEGVVTEQFAAQGVPVPLEACPWEKDPSRMVYTAQLPEPVPPGESFEAIAVSRSTTGDDRAHLLGDGRWRYAQTKGLGNQRDACVFIVGVRLPEGARVLDAAPAPDEVRQAGRRTTVVWRLTPAPAEETDFVVGYRL